MTTEQLLKFYNRKTKEAVNNVSEGSYKERALYLLLEEYKEKIKGWIEDDSTGYSFHKSFRQNDITGKTNIDLAIWMLLQDAPVFWKLIETYNNFIGKTIKASNQVVKIIDIDCDDLEFYPVIIDKEINGKNKISFEDIQEVLTNYHCTQCKLSEQCSVTQNTSFKTCENCGSYKEEVWQKVKLINYWF